jgi:hypothetical protein
MRLFNKTFFTLLFSFGVLLVVSFILLLLTNYFINAGTPESTCITSSGEACY